MALPPPPPSPHFPSSFSLTSPFSSFSPPQKDRLCPGFPFSCNLNCLPLSCSSDCLSELERTKCLSKPGFPLSFPSFSSLYFLYNPYFILSVLFFPPSLPALNQPPLPLFHNFPSPSFTESFLLDFTRNQCSSHCTHGFC